MEAKGEITPDPDAKLMLRVRDGDQKCFQDLFVRHSPALVGFVDRFFRNRAVAEEVVQEVFLKVYRARKSYQIRSKFTTWLYTIATRTCYNELRRGVHRAKFQALEESSPKHTRSAESSAQQDLEARRLAELVDRTLQNLPENQRSAFMLVRFGGRSYAEVAEILDLGLSAVKSLVFRATDAVRQALAAHEVEKEK